MEIIYPDEFLEFLNKNKDIDSIVDIDFDNETYNYDPREDFDDYEDVYNYDPSTEDYDYTEPYYYDDYDYRNYDDEDSENIRNDDKKDPLIKNKLVKLKIPYINIGVLRPPFPPFTPWQGPWWPWNWPWSSHFPWNYPWSMHKNCDEFGHCKYDSKNPKKNYDIKPRTYEDSNYSYSSESNIDFEDVDFYYVSPDEIRATAPQPEEGYQVDKPPIIKPPAEPPAKNSEDIMMLTHEGFSYGVPPSYATSPKPLHNKFISPEYLRRCMFKLIYIWQTNGQAYWAYLTRVDRSLVSGWRWVNMRWVPFRQNVNRINYIFCNTR